ncbi:MAG: hypothetical protein IJW51_00110 [Clostridia bacterium]|nr:hypothetical protein [Clostridia bacterium]
MTVTFFGHRDTPRSILLDLYSVLEYLILNEDAKLFLVGNQGEFDKTVLFALTKLKKIYSHICCQIVFAYMPNRNLNLPRDIDTVFPLQAANSLPRFAIEKRNIWMLNESDLVITYVARSHGGAAHFKKRALSQGKRVIELAKNIHP